ncbi:hypothetical protein EDD15DRAFT_2194709 [Pisolithus albus]|nr:hypothetical protein EDD15DRAFT_2194709 [Pisolithus albus]
MNVICRSQLHSILESWNTLDLGEAIWAWMTHDQVCFGLHVVERPGGGNVAARDSLPVIFTILPDAHHACGSHIGQLSGPDRSCMPQRTDFSTAISATMITGEPQLDRIWCMCSTIMQSYPSCSRTETGHTPLRPGHPNSRSPPTPEKYAFRFPTRPLVRTPVPCSPQQRPYEPAAAAGRTENAGFGQESGSGRQHPPAPRLPSHGAYAAAAHPLGGCWPFYMIFCPWTPFPTPGAGSIPQWSPAKMGREQASLDGSTCHGGTRHHTSRLGWRKRGWEHGHENRQRAGETKDDGERVGDIEGLEVEGGNEEGGLSWAGEVVVGMHIRIANEVTTETQLRSVVDAMSDQLGGVSDFCVCPDYHESVGRYAFVVELQGNLGEFLVLLHKPCWYAHRPRAQIFLYAGASTVTAPSPFHASLHDLNENYLRDSLSGKIDVPVVRVLRPNTFGDFRRWKIRTSGGAAVGRVEVPVVVWERRAVFVPFLKEDIWRIVWQGTAVWLLKRKRAIHKASLSL